jgi:hypothetical protein
MPPPEHEEQREMTQEAGRPEEAIDTRQMHRRHLKLGRPFQGAKWNDFMPNGGA